MMTKPQCLLVLLIGFTRELVHAIGKHKGLPIGIPALMANFYTRYDAYPPYCSLPLEMTKRSIPALRPNIHLGDSRLTHVTAVIRHGARTPWSGSEQCWDGYWSPDADTGTWDCELTTFLSPPSPRVVDAEEGVYASESDAMFLFEKKYDALSAPQSNELRGTCQLGQLLLQGHDQELANGQHLRDAYVYDGSTMNHDIKLRLLDLSNSKTRPYESPVLKYRADDDQRTLMSGQILLRGMFGTEFVEHIKKNGQHAIIPLHVADRSKDILDPNAAECPRLTELEATAKASKEFKAFNNTLESKVMNSFIANEMGSSDSPLDCLMTTICTDRTLPESLNDYKGHGRELHNDCNRKMVHEGSDEPHRDLHKSDDDDDCDQNYGSNLFERVAKFDTERSVFPYIYNDAEYSKVAMAPLWAEIMDEIVPITTGGDDRNARSSNKMHVISGHDTTIIPLMASIGAWKLAEWPAYASMMLIELHELVDGKTDRSVYPSRYAFRLIYNGEVLTDRVPGCQKEHDLCDFGILKTIVDSFGGRDRDCSLTSISSTTSKQSSSSGGVFSFFLTVIISAALGAFVAVYYLKSSLGSKYRTLYEESDGIMMTNGGVRYRDEIGSDQQEEQDAPTMLVI